MTPEAIYEARKLIDYWMNYRPGPPPPGSPTAVLDALCEAAKQAGNLSPMDVRAADKLARAVNKLVKRGVIDARSDAADRLLDYCSGRFGDSNPIGSLELLDEPAEPARVAHG